MRGTSVVKSGKIPAEKPASIWGRRKLRHVLLAVLLLLAAGAWLSSQTEQMIDAADRWLVKNGLAVTRVTVTGNQQLSDRAIRQALGDVTQHSVLRFDVKAAKARLEALGWVRHAEITRRLPGSLHIAITERRPFALWQTKGQLFLIDRDGNIIRTNPGIEYSDLPLITGIAGNLAAADILDALAKVPDLQVQTRAAVRVAARRWNLEMTNGVVVKLPEHGYVAALSTLAQLDRKLGLLKREIKSIDLRIAGQMTLQLTKDAATRRNFLIHRGSRQPLGRHAI